MRNFLLNSENSLSFSSNISIDVFNSSLVIMISLLMCSFGYIGYCISLYFSIEDNEENGNMRNILDRNNNEEYFEYEETE